MTEMDLQRFAMLRAELDAGSPLSEVLDDAGIGEHAWQNIETEWLTRIAVAAADQDFDFTKRYNRAFEEARRRMGLSSDPVGAPPSMPASMVHTPRGGGDEISALPYWIAAPGEVHPHGPDAVPVLPFVRIAAGDDADEAAPEPASDVPETRPSEPKASVPEQRSSSADARSGLLFAEPEAPAERPSSRPPEPALSFTESDAPATTQRRSSAPPGPAMPFVPAEDAPAEHPPSPPPDAARATPFQRIDVPATTQRPSSLREQPVVPFHPRSESEEGAASPAKPPSKPPSSELDLGATLDCESPLPKGDLPFDEEQKQPLKTVALEMLPRGLADFVQRAEGSGKTVVLPPLPQMETMVAQGVTGGSTLPFESPEPTAEPRLTLEQYASLSAELTCSERGRVFERYGVDEDAWQAECEAYDRLFANDGSLRKRFDELCEIYVDYLQRQR
jgi:hypothetical protein